MKYIFPLFVILFMGPAAFACTGLQLSLASSSVNLTSSPSTTSNAIVKGNTQGAAGGCTFFVTADYGLSTTYSSRALRLGTNQWPFQITKDSGDVNPLKKLADTTSNNDILTGSMTANTGNGIQVTIPYWVFLDQTNTWRLFGNYTENLTLTLYSGTFAAPVLVGTQTLSINYTAPKRTDVAIENTGGTFAIGDTSRTLNFGTMTTGAVQTCDVIVKSNAGYILLASSANNGAMKHTRANKTISYTAQFNGSTVSLAGSATTPVQIATVSGLSPASGFVIPAKITLGTVSAATFGGTYQDVITLTVQSAD